MSHHTMMAMVTHEAAIHTVRQVMVTGHIARQVMATARHPERHQAMATSLSARLAMAAMSHTAQQVMATASHPARQAMAATSHAARQVMATASHPAWQVMAATSHAVHVHVASRQSSSPVPTGMHRGRFSYLDCILGSLRVRTDCTIYSCTKIGLMGTIVHTTRT